MNEKEIYSNLKEAVKVRKEIYEKQEKERAEEAERKRVANLPENIAERLYNEIIGKLYKSFLESIQNLTNKIKKANDTRTILYTKSCIITLFLRESLEDEASKLLVKKIKNKLDDIMKDNELNSIIDADVVYRECITEDEDDFGFSQSGIVQQEIIITITLR